MLSLKMSSESCFLMIVSLSSHVLQYSASPSLLPPLHSQLQCPAGLSRGSCSNCILLSGSSPSSPACGLCPLPCLSEPPGPPRVCLQAARSTGPPTAHHHPTDVPGIFGHGQSLFLLSWRFLFYSFFRHDVIRLDVVLPLLYTLWLAVIWSGYFLMSWCFKMKCIMLPLN